MVYLFIIHVQVYIYVYNMFTLDDMYVRIKLYRYL